MNVGIIQFKATKGDVPSSRARLAALTEEAAKTSDIVVLPEMAATGYSFETRDEVMAVAEPSDGPTAELFRDIAKRHACWIVIGFAERDADLLYNSALVLDDQGDTAFVYRKTMLYEADLHWATPGDSGYPLLECAGERFTVGICMDLNDDSFITWLREVQPRLLAFPTNWISEGVPVWPYWAWRLQGLQIGLAAANSYGPDGDVIFTGESALIDGVKVLAAAPENGDGYLVVELPTQR